MGSNWIGKIIENRYRIDQFIASGGMGAVYKIFDLQRNVPLAMKILHAELAEDPSIFRGFQREAKALMKLRHPHIVRFYGLGQADGIVYILEDFIDGPTLKDILRDRKILPVDEVLVYLKALCSSLGYAHHEKVIHCDVKPGNVMLDSGGNIYIADFGISRNADSTATSTLAGAGTPVYMAPEQIRGEAVSEETDIYALGVILFELFTGQRPFRGTESETGSKGGTTANERLRYAHLFLAPPDPQTINPELPDRLAAVLIKTLSKNRGDRFKTTQELFSAICQALQVNPAAVPDCLPRETQSVPARPQESAPEQVVLSHQRRAVQVRAYQVAIAACVIILLAGMLILGLRLGNPAKLAPTIPLPAAAVHTPAATSLAQPQLETAEPPLGQSGLAAPGHAQVEAAAPSLAPRIPKEAPSEPPPSTPTRAPARFVADQKVNSMDQETLVLIPAGEFQMGNNNDHTAPYFWGAEAPRHTVFLDSFWIYLDEVTNAMYQECVTAKVCPLPAHVNSRTHQDYFKNPAYVDYPVIFVNYADATAYCQWAGGRLPTEAEWEKAARGTDVRFNPWGNDPPAPKFGNFNFSSYHDTAPVGQFPDGASFYGILDMAGNVWEWVFDYYQANYYESSPKNNPRGPASGNKHPIRGGAWFNPVEGAISSVRASITSDHTDDSTGFRCAVDASR